MDFGIKMAELEHEQMSLHHHERAPVPWKCGACFLRADNTPPVGHTQSAMERAAKTTGGEFGAPPEMGAHTRPSGRRLLSAVETEDACIRRP